MEKPVPTRMSITWCISPVNGCKQCDVCKRNKARYTFPEYGTFTVQILSPDQKQAARAGMCPGFKCDYSARRTQRVKDRREKALQHTECAECRFLGWGVRSRAAIPYCENHVSEHHGNRCPAEGRCGCFFK